MDARGRLLSTREARVGWHLMTKINMVKYRNGRSTSSRDDLTAIQCDLSRRTSLCLQHEPYSAIFILFRSQEDDHDRKQDVCSVLLHPMY